MSPDTVPMLTVRDLRVGYGGSTVLDGVSLDVGAGETVAILGRNGAGKTTLIHTILGLLRPTGGRIAVAGRELTAAPTHVVAQAGVAVVPQGRRVFAPLTVAEHLRICRPMSTSDKPQWTPERVVELLPRLGERWRHRGDQLSGGEQQMLAIARALLTNPRLLLLDEPSDGLAPAVVARVGDVIERLRADGLTIVLVEQNLRLAFRLATRVAVLAKGRVAVDTPTADFRADGDRARRLLGV